MSVAVSIILAVLAVTAVAFPFFRPALAQPRRKGGVVEGAGGVGLATELESDYRTGIISKDEYDELAESLSPPTKAESGAGGANDEDYDIERRVRQLRQKKRTQATSSAASTSTAASANRAGVTRAIACPKCGRPYRQGDRFCRACGARLTGGGR